ncbi:MAG: LON peptidase substrate-binding domain-containing protein [Alphaproteobacteria bacterium]
MTPPFAYRRVEDLPTLIPIFPLPGALLLPRGKLPLNIFEPRYLEMTEAAMASHRLIGMVQPSDANAPLDRPEVYRTGCAGRIVRYAETEDGRYLITLAGIARFEIVAEPPLEGRLYRRAEVSFKRYAHDLESPGALRLDRARLMPALRCYFQVQGLTADWQTIEKTPDDHLLTCLAMICPFKPNEKQALLEYPTDAERGEAIIALLEMAVLEARGTACPERRQ